MGKLIFEVLWISSIAGFIAWNRNIADVQNVPVNHGNQVKWRALVGGILALLVFFIFGRSWYDLSMFLGFEFFSFGLLFAPFLNKARGKEWFYVEGKDKTDEFLRWVFRHIQPQVYYFVIFILALVFGVFFILGTDGFSRNWNAH